MATPITDDELFALAMVQVNLAPTELLASIQMRFDADAAKIAERDAEIARLHSDHGDRVMALCETVKRLRAVAVKALPMNGKCSHGIAGRTCSDAVEELRVAVSALAPGDLGGEGE